MANQQPQKSPAKTVSDFMEKHRGQIQAALPKQLDADRLTRISMTEIRTNPKLLECDPRSLLGAVIQSAQLGLEPGIMGQAYLIPFKSKGKMEVQFIPGYKGLLTLARRSGQVRKIETGVVRQGDTFEVEFGTDEKLRHVPARNRGNVEYLYAIAKLNAGDDGGVEDQFEVMSVEEIEDIRKSSKAGQSGPWVDWWEQMARKTIAKRLIKWLPTSVEAQEAVAMDEKADAGVSQGNESVIEGAYQEATDTPGGKEAKSGNVPDGNQAPPMSEPEPEQPPAQEAPQAAAPEPERSQEPAPEPETEIAGDDAPPMAEPADEEEPAQEPRADGDLPMFGED